MLSGVGIICFAASYVIALLCDLPRTFSRRLRESPVLPGVFRAVSLGFLIAGFVAHTAYLFWHHAARLHHFIASEQAFCFLVAWGIVAICLHLTRMRPALPLPVFLLPIALALIALGTYGANDTPFRASTQTSFMRGLHVFSFLATCLLLAIGAAAALMYFEQARCLKHKRNPLLGMRLPSLEWSRALAVSTFFGALCGVFAGALTGSILAVDPAMRSGAQPANPSNGLLGGLDPLMLWAIAMLLLWIVFTIRGFLTPGRQSRLEIAAPLVTFLLLLSILLLTFLFRTAHWNGGKPVSHWESPTPAVFRLNGDGGPDEL